jgi:hypothetical protein
MDRQWRWVVGIAGLLLLAVGVLLTALDRDGGSVVAVIVVGALLVASPLMIGRLTRLSIGLDGVSLGLASDIAQIAPRAARILDDSELIGLAESYAFVREELSGTRHHQARVALQDLLVKRAASLALRRKFDATEVRRLFAEGTLIIRVLALGLMKGDPSLADVPTIRAAIAESRSANEQYHGLLLAEQQWYRLPRTDRSALLAAIDETQIEAGSDRAAIADRIRAVRPDAESTSGSGRGG